MATSITLDDLGVTYPDGTAVSVYLERQRVGDQQPSGQRATFGTVAGGSVTFSNLVEGTEYVVYGVVAGQAQLVGFRTPGKRPTITSSTQQQPDVLEPFVTPEQFGGGQGGDDTAAFANAIGEVGSGGLIVCSNVAYTASLDLTNKTGIRICGQGTGRAGTTIRITSVTGTLVKANSAQSCRLEHMLLEATAGTFAGIMVDFSRVAAGAGTHDTSMNGLVDVRVSMPTGSDGIGVALSGSYGTALRDMWITGGLVGLDGILDNTHFLNISEINNVNFGQQKVAAARNLTGDAANATSFYNCTFEPLVDGTACAYVETFTHSSGIVGFHACWSGDATGGGAWLRPMGGQIEVHGASRWKNGDGLVQALGDCAVVIVGGIFDSMTHLVDPNGHSVEHYVMKPKLRGAPVPDIPGPYADNSIVQVQAGNGVLHVVGQSVAADSGGTTHVRIGNANGTRPAILMGASEAASLQSDSHNVIYASQGLGTAVKTAPVTDASFAAAPPDGTIVLGSDDKLWARRAGVWKSAALT